MKKYKTNDIVHTLVKMRLEKVASNYTIMHFLKEELGYNNSFSYTLMNRADKYIAELYKKEDSDLILKRTADLMEQRERAKKSGDRRIELEITKELNKIQGLYVEKHQIDGIIKIPDTITFVLPPNKDEE